MEKEKDYCNECERTLPVENLFFGYWAILCEECRKELGYTESRKIEEIKNSDF